MKKFDVRYYREERSSVRMNITVNADSPEAARQRVLDWGEGRIELTPEEEETEECGKEELLDGEFSCLEIESDPYAVVEVPADPLPKWDVFAARDGDTYRSTIEAEDEDHAKQIARPFINAHFRMDFTNEQIVTDTDSFDGELAGFLVEEKR